VPVPFCLFVFTCGSILSACVCKPVFRNLTTYVLDCWALHFVLHCIEHVLLSSVISSAI